MKLSSRARNLLRDADQALRGASRMKKRRGKVVNEVVAWCQAHDIELGPRLSHARLQLDRDLLARVDETLFALGEPALAAELSGLTTAEQAHLGNREEKSVREKPRDRRVLASFPAAMERRPGLASRPRDFLDLDWCELDLDAFDALIQVENLDSFYAFMPHAHWRLPLVAYRGDRHYGGGFAALAEAWSARGKPHLYVGDFDAAGIGMAMASRATHLLLPPLAWLERHATADHLPATQSAVQARQREYRATLPDGHPLRDYLAIILDRQCGLRQQWFGDDWIMVPLD
ncbi:DUF7281 domain-containing protein [Halomonas sp. C05BenzN]|uniref:DUF7281 domain-containing protein n=1 Tax=Halomonas sp. C05BenzN TaxID=3411041 RepID=UPI003B92EEE3